ncbi:hypothetical protein [Lysinibacillus piscis]|uniref:Uncharacterized protein n=1 Tax=Lysinibacillus piscis TaxID=2518931 RepID=A0ABQ5NMF8_9BACI|nr:hypothetical protein [Lysinibacillus sp. KH24]GLC89547.1 hypothetical protein LYSBPC_26740 [Lysinibacillus sp. KH24]
MNIKQELENTLPPTMTMTEQEKLAIRYRIQQSTKAKNSWKPVIASIGALLLVAILAITIVTKPEQETIHTSQPQEEVIVTEEKEPDVILTLTDEEKKRYYAQYAKSLEWVHAQKVGLQVSLVPIEEYNRWIDPQVFDQEAKSWVTNHLAIEQEKIAAISPDPIMVNSDGRITKTTYVYIPAILKTLEVTGHFTTAYSPTYGRYIFTSASDISATKPYYVPSQQKWQQTAYKVSLIDGGRTYRIYIEGFFEIAGGVTEKAFTIEFHCDENGTIS